MYLRYLTLKSRNAVARVTETKSPKFVGLAALLDYTYPLILSEIVNVQLLKLTKKCTFTAMVLMVKYRSHAVILTRSVRDIWCHVQHTTGLQRGRKALETGLSVEITALIDPYTSGKNEHFQIGDIRKPKYRCPCYWQKIAIVSDRLHYRNRLGLSRNGDCSFWVEANSVQTSLNRAITRVEKWPGGGNNIQVYIGYVIGAEKFH